MSSDLEVLFTTDPLGLTIDWEKVSNAEIFGMEPDTLEKAQEAAIKSGRRGPVDKIIERLRAARAQYMAGDKTAGNAKKTVARPKGEKVEVSLDDLGL